MKKKKIPCRVCGKLFEPCAACQSKTSFTWRDFACSRKCATEYINQAIQDREAQKKSISSEPSTITQSKYDKEKEKLEVSKNNKEDNFINKEQKNIERKRKNL